jgi:hypothetical protein
MNKIEEFYKEAGGVEYDKFDKKANKFSYYDIIGFASAYHSKHVKPDATLQKREMLEAYAKIVSERYTHHFFADAIEESINEFLAEQP